MAKGLIGRHLNDYSPVFNMEGVWHRPRRKTLWNDYCSWQVDDKPRSLFLSMNLCIQCQCMYIYVCLFSLCMGSCALYECLCVSPCLSAFLRMCECACDMAARHAYGPCGVPYSEPPQSREDLHQTDYSTATMTASNGRNKTPFNEDANLRNITLCRWRCNSGGKTWRDTGMSHLT